MGDQLLEIHCSFVEEQLSGAEQRLEEFHRALAREHLQASERRFHDLQRSRQPRGARRRTTPATVPLAQDRQEASSSMEPASSSASASTGADALAERPDTLHEQ